MQPFQPLPEPLVERNEFRGSRPAATSLPTFDDVRPGLPAPVLPEDPAWEELYWAAWSALWARLKPPAAASRFVAPLPLPGDGTPLETEALAFVAQLSGYVAPLCLVSILDNLYVCQHDDGFIGRAFDPQTGYDLHQPYEPNSTGPNLAPWAEWRHFRLTGDSARISAVFWPLLAYHRWCRANRRWPNGLYWSTSYSGGLVNQPRVPGARYHHRHWAWVDATAQAALSAAFLERMAVVLGEQELGHEVAAERTQLARLFNDHMWHAGASFYQDVAPDGGFSPVKSIGAYWALLDSQLVPSERLAPFVQHLRDSWSFRTPGVIPSMSADSEAYNARSGNGWRGGVWPALTYMVLRGLEVAQQPSLAHQLAVAHVERVAAEYARSGCFWDNYAPEDDGPGDPSTEDLSGRTPAAIVGMMLENVLGIHIDWPLRQVTWRPYLTRAQPYGVRGLPLGREGTLDLTIAPRPVNGFYATNAGKTVSIRADVPFTLVLQDGQDVVRTAVPAGQFDLDLD